MSDFIVRDGPGVYKEATCRAHSLIHMGRVERVAAEGLGIAREVRNSDTQWDMGLHGVIDDQVHFGEPGPLREEDIPDASAALGATGSMEMPNTQPRTSTQDTLAAHFDTGPARSLVNCSCHMEMSNDNLDEAMHEDPATAGCLKTIAISRAGNRLPDKRGTLDALFPQANMFLALHAADGVALRSDLQKTVERYAVNIHLDRHSEDYHVDLVQVDRNASRTMDRNRLLSRCGWSTFEGQRSVQPVVRIWMNGTAVCADGLLNGTMRGERSLFDR